MITLLLLLGTLFNTVSSTSTPCSGTSYSVPFPYGATNGVPDLVVAAGGATLPYSSGWTINKVSSTSTGTITLTTACTGTLTITRTTPRTQPLPLRTQGKLDLDALSTTLDRIEMQMQESVGQGGGAVLSSLSVATPIPLSSGGTGTASLPNCGAGVVTSDGTKLSCVTLSGLAPPGTTGVLLQTVTPGSVQTGHMNISGTLAINGVNSTTGGRIFAQNAGVGQIVYNFPGTLGASANAHQFDVTSISAFQTVANYTTQGGTQVLAKIGVGSATNIARLTIGASGGAEINSGTGGIPLTIQGSGTGTNQVVIDTQGISPSGNLLDVRLAGASKAAIATTGVITSTGLTSSGGVSGTSGTFSGTLAVTGTSTHTGATALNGGVTIGSGGTATSKSVRGTLAVGSGSIPAQSCVDQNITVTGAVTGADCALGQTAFTVAGTISQCMITASAADTCVFRTCNVTSGSITVPANTLSCRVFNP